LLGQSFALQQMQARISRPWILSGMQQENARRAILGIGDARVDRRCTKYPETIRDSWRGSSRKMPAEWEGYRSFYVAPTRCVLVRQGCARRDDTHRKTLVGIGDFAMAHVGYPLVMVAVLCWLRFGPLHSWGLYVALGCILAAIVFVLSALVMRKWRALVMFFVLLAVWIVGDFAAFAYRLNNVCGPGDHIIQSEAAAIRMAKALALSGNYGSSHVFDDRPELVVFRQTDGCCAVTRTRTLFGVIVWKVSLLGVTVGEMQARDVRAFVAFSNCGELFVDDSSISTVPKKVNSIWPTIK
jgi:hypothetical protein